MGGESPKPASTTTPAVFLSYASQDADAARRICDALRASGILVWFDQSELRGGDAWDRQIRTQIHECRLFMPIVSAHTEERLEGYFRREWKLAVDRTHDLSERMAFLVPIVIDSTSELKADVPDAFRHVQWTRLPSGETSAAFVERVRRLVTPEPSSAPQAASPPPAFGSAQISTTAIAAPPGYKPALWATGAVVVLAIAYFVTEKFWVTKHGPQDLTAATNKPVTSLSNSIAVLPFADLSEKRDQEYFADGLADEVLSLLATLPGLDVISRTSSFQFKGQTADLRAVGAHLGAAYVVEGSVRRSGDRVRVTAQLISAQDGADRWSDTYERKFGDVLRLQQDIATSLGRALQVEVGGLAEQGAPTHPEAYTAYLHGVHAMDRFDEAGLDESVSYFEQSLAMEPSLLRARENLARARYYQYAFGFVPPRIAAERLRGVVDDVLRINPRSATGHALRAELLISYDWAWAAGQREAELAV